ncbi:MAG: PAS domain S-box protein [Desulfobacterales bacterium]|nr:PAS domain S-box protein [Desulfobacterales bacterium]
MLKIKVNTTATTDICRDASIIGALLGALMLVSLSYGQKIITGYVPSISAAYIIPTVFGLIFGFFHGRYINKLKSALEALKKSKEKYRAIADFTFDWEYWRDLNGNLIYVSPSCEKISGYQAREFIRDPSLFFSLVHPDDREKVKQNLTHMTESTDTCKLTFRIINRNKSVRWIQHNCLSVYDRNGNWLGRRGNNHDFTALKAAEDASLNHAKRFKIFFEATSDAIFVHPFRKDGFQPFIEVNPIACRRYGYSRDEFLKLTVADITEEVFPEKHETVNDPNLLFESQHQVFEALHRTKTGEQISVETNRNILEQSGELFIISVVRDISDRKQAEAEKEKLQIQLQQRHKMEAIGTLAGGISHDFNNILSGILGYANLLQMNLDENAPAKEYLHEIVNAANRASDLVHQILTFSRQAENKPRPFTFSVVVKEALKLIRSTVPVSIEIKKEITSKAKIMADPTQIHQVVMNLCTNAYQSMGHMDGVLSVGLYDTEIKDAGNFPPGKYIRLDVKDTGPGMNPETQMRIFDPYFTTKDFGKGTGLGLSTVDGIVKKHNGFIKVKSREGIGTVFQVFLPAFEKETFQENVKQDPKKPFEKVLSE